MKRPSPQGRLFPASFSEGLIGFHFYAQLVAMLFEFFQALKKLSLGFGLIAMAATVLLLTDLKSRRRSANDDALSGEKRVLRVALVQHASIKALTDGVKGVIQALEQRGFVDGEKIKIVRYNAEGDIGTANAIAKEVTSDDFDLILTMSTVSLQTVANANKVGRRTKHVFGLVSDPYVAGVGIDAQDHRQHPPYMTGFGSMQPVKATIERALQMRPELKRLGLVWNPAEANSQAQTMLARQVCKELEIELVEGSAESSTAVLESANSVVARGVDALWLSGDITVSLASDALIKAAKQGRIPVFTSLPPNCLRGALFDFGADYVEIGRLLGDLAADVLEGKNPADVPVENLVPAVFMYNESVLGDLRDRWTIPEAVKKEASGWITATGEKKLPPHIDSTF